MPMNSCDNVKALFSDYIDDSLSAEQRAQVDAHTADCAECRMVLKQVAHLTQRIQTMSAISASDAFDQSLRNRIMENYATESKSSLKRSFTFGFSGAAVLAALTFFILSTFEGPSVETVPAGISGAAPKAQPELIRREAAPQSALAAETLKKDSLKNTPARVDQKIQLVGQDK